jgi:GntR family transcriptional regulator
MLDNRPGLPLMPMYYQIRTHLLEAIENGTLKTGGRVPSERELTEQFSVSRMTVRQALSELESQGYLIRIQGKGTFVGSPKFEQPLTTLTSFTEEMRQRGLEPGATVLSSDELIAGAKLAGTLQILPTDSVYRFQRLRLANGEPMALENVHLSSQLCPGLIDIPLQNQSLYQVLAERYAIHLGLATQSLEAVAAGPYEAALLQVREGTPLLSIERLSRDQNDRPVEYVRSLYRGDRYRFTAELSRKLRP